MSSKWVRVALFILVINVLVMPSTSLRSSKSYGRTSNNGKHENSKTLVGTSPGIPNRNATRRGLGISAWGIIAIIMTIILAGVCFYYISICYPIFYNNQNKYNMMMPSAV